MKTQRVIFRKWRGSGDVIAFFLAQPETPGHCTCYEHIAQHGEGAYPHPQTVAAGPSEYAALLRELAHIGYNDLRIVTRGSIKQPRACSTSRQTL